MELKVFAIRDKATEAYANPFYMTTIPEAIRAFKNVAMEPESNICKHPQDYELYQLGTFDNISGMFKDKIINFGTALAVQQEKDNVEELHKETA